MHVCDKSLVKAKSNFYMYFDTGVTQRSSKILKIGKAMVKKSFFSINVSGIKNVFFVLNQSIFYILYSVI